MRVLVLGGEGMLGGMVFRVLSSSKNLSVERTWLTEAGDVKLRFDVDDGPDGFKNILARRGPFDTVINCIGILSGAIDDKNPVSVTRAERINAKFPHELASVACEAGARVIQISTDGVFSGAADSPYFEDSPSDCTDVYGKSKSAGEVRAPGFLNLRCSIIGSDPVGKKGILEWFLAQPDGGTLTGYTDHVWNGVTTLQFAKICGKLIEEAAFDRVRKESPIHHFCPNLPISKFELLGVFKSVFGRKVTIEPKRAPGGPLKRVLGTRFRGLRELFGEGLRIEAAVHELAALENNKTV